MFAQMERPRGGFGFSVACFVLSWLLYVYDYRLILQRRSTFEDTAPRRTLYQHVLDRQRLISACMAGDADA